MNIHVDTDSKPPKDWSEVEKTLALIQFWYRWNEPARKYLIKEVEGQPDFWCDTIAGINLAVLKSLQEIDPEKLKEELAPLLERRRCDNCTFAKAHATDEGWYWCDANGLCGGDFGCIHWRAK